MTIEAARFLSFHCSLGPDVLLIRNFSGSEKLGECFEYVLTLFSTDANLKAEDLLGQHASVGVKVGKQPERFFDGIVCEFGPAGYVRRYAVYRAVLRPWFWLLSRTRECRVFQKQTTLDIFNKIAKDKWGFTDLEVNLFYSLKEREYCVQYRESDLTFLMRLLEEEGIYFYFKHQQGTHKLVLADSISAHDSVAGFETVHSQRVDRVDPAKPQGTMITWTSNKRVQPGGFALLDYDFKKPTADLAAGASDPKQHKHADGEVFDWPGYYEEAPVGQDRAKVRLHELQSSYEIAEGSTDATGLFSGALFTLASHPRDAENREYLITAVTYSADSGTFETGASSQRFAARITAIDSSVPFRPARITPAPLIAGAQTATVVGPKDSEIWSEEHGRVKIQFHWDRHGESDENSSCWVRVAQAWAGAKWGALFIPRIGQEVVVDFLEGNPDRPLITGSVYNGLNMPPYDLPDQQTQSGWKTRSSKDGGPDDYNELMFEDKKGAEQIRMHAQRDLAITVEHDETVNVTNDVTVNVAEGNYATTIEQGFRRIEVKKNNYDLSAIQISEFGEKQIQMMVGPCTILIDLQQIKLTAFTSEIKLDATGVTISTAGGTSTVAITPAGVSANGPMVKLNS